MKKLTIAILFLASALWAQNFYHYDPNVIFTSWNIRHDTATQQEFFNIIQQHCRAESPSAGGGSSTLWCWTWVETEGKK